MTELQQTLMDRIHAFLEAGPEGPTTKDLQAAFPFRNETGVLKCLEGLEAAGHLVRVRDRWTLKTPDVQLHFELGGGEARPVSRPKR
jgi:hypothetical protein